MLLFMLMVYWRIVIQIQGVKYLFIPIVFWNIVRHYKFFLNRVADQKRQLVERFITNGLLLLQMDLLFLERYLAFFPIKICELFWCCFQDPNSSFMQIHLLKADLVCCFF